MTTNFSDLGIGEVLVRRLEELNLAKPTPIQAGCIPKILEGHDVLGCAKTGTGKTLAFALPILQALMESPQKLFALVLTPTRELAFQITEQFEAVGSTIGLVVSTIVGGIDMATQALSLGKRPHVVVATPGRLVDHLENTKGFSLKTLKYLVMDEADRILNMDFEVDLEKILRAVPRDRRTLIFSATMTKKVSKLERACLKDPVRVELATKYHTVDALIQNYLFIPYKYKEAYLVHYLSKKSGNTVIVFCSTCAGVVKLALMLRELGFGAVALNGKMSQPTRLGALNKFKKKDRAIMVCTDVASRGLDIPHVDAVVNYDLPNQPKDYIHRVGRTARAGRAGNSLTIVTQYDVEQYTRIEEFIGKKLPELQVDQNEAMQLVERVSEAARHAVKRYKEIEGSNGGKRKLREAIEDEAPTRKHKKAEIVKMRKSRR